MKLFVNTQTQECGMYGPSDLDDNNWIEAPKGTQAVYWSIGQRQLMFYKMKHNTLSFCLDGYSWFLTSYTVEKLNSPADLHMKHLWGTLQDFDL